MFAIMLVRAIKVSEASTDMLYCERLQGRQPPAIPSHALPGVAFPHSVLPYVDPPQHNVTVTLSIC